MGVTVAIVGLGFGRDFVPIYRSHPDVDRVVVVDADQHRRAAVAAEFAIAADDARATVDDVLADTTIDAVHILTPVSTHADLAVKALRAGKHVACAVPMATTLADLTRIIDAQERSGTVYMMMETSVYGREYLQVESLFTQGMFGELTLYRGFHLQNLDGFPTYWQGYPPMHYATHALSPALALLHTTVETVRCRGAGRLTAERQAGGYDNPFPAEVALFSLRGSAVLADVTVAFFQTAHPFAEGFALYGENGGFEWAGDDAHPGQFFRMLPPDTGDRGNRVDRVPWEDLAVIPTLPPSIAHFTESTDVLIGDMPEAVRMNPAHGGSHPYLVHEFVSSIVEGREPRISARVAASWTAPGIVAHQSARDGGAELMVPDYSR